MNNKDICMKCGAEDLSNKRTSCGVYVMYEGFCPVCIEEDYSHSLNHSLLKSVDVMSLKIDELTTKLNDLTTTYESDKATYYRDDNWRNNTYKVCKD
jgi:hypothetical protein